MAIPGNTRVSFCSYYSCTKYGSKGKRAQPIDQPYIKTSKNVTCYVHAVCEGVVSL